jgi:LysM repeat protein
MDQSHRMRKLALSLTMKFSTLMPNERPPNPDRGGANLHARLTEDRVHQIIGLLVEGQTRSAIAKQFGVTETTIRRTAKGEAWKQVPRPTNFASVIRHSTAKLTEAHVREMRRLLKAGDTQQVDSRKFNVGSRLLVTSPIAVTGLGSPTTSGTFATSNGEARISILSLAHRGLGGATPCGGD